MERPRQRSARGRLVVVVVVAACAASARAFEVVNGHAASSWLVASFGSDPRAGSGIRVLSGKVGTLCVPPKSGSEAVHHAIPGQRLEWIGDPAGQAKAGPRHGSDPAERPEGSHLKIERWLFDADRIRVAIVRHPVERIVSAARSFGVGRVCGSCRGMQVAHAPGARGSSAVWNSTGSTTRHFEVVRRPVRAMGAG